MLGGLGMAVAFFILWFPLSEEWIAVQFCFNLIFYDTFLTWVELNYSALLADISEDSGVRYETTLHHCALCLWWGGGGMEGGSARWQPVSNMHTRA